MFKCIVYVSILLVFLCNSLDHYSKGHYHCNNIAHNINCEEHDYFKYVKQNIKQIMNLTEKSVDEERKLNILQSILGMYDDLNFSIRPLIFNESFNGSIFEVQVVPISLTIPNWNIRQSLSAKIRTVFPVIPGDRSTYILNESNYYNDLKTSAFAITIKKAGWDCFRHLEILSNGVIPLFFGIHTCPDSALSFHPKQLYRHLLNYPGIDLERNHLLELNINNTFLTTLLSSKNDYDFYVNVCDSLLQYTRNVFSGTAVAAYVIEHMQARINISSEYPKKVLYLTTTFEGMEWGDYMTDVLLIGFKSLLGGYKVVDFPRKSQIYADSKELHYTNFMHKKSKTYGSGYGWASEIHDKLDSNERDKGQVIDNIVNRRYDLIVVGDLHNSWRGNIDTLDYVCRYYMPHEVAAVYGDDSPLPLKLIRDYTHCIQSFFTREGFEGLKFRDGSLVKVASQNSIYFIENGTRREFDGLNSFINRGYDLDQVLRVHRYQELEYYTRPGEPIVAESP